MTWLKCVLNLNRKERSVSHAAIKKITPSIVQVLNKTALYYNIHALFARAIENLEKAHIYMFNRKQKIIARLRKPSLSKRSLLRR